MTTPISHNEALSEALGALEQNPFAPDKLIEAALRQRVRAGITAGLEKAVHIAILRSEAAALGMLAADVAIMGFRAAAMDMRGLLGEVLTYLVPIAENHEHVNHEAVSKLVAECSQKVSDWDEVFKATGGRDVQQTAH